MNFSFITGYLAGYMHKEGQAAPFVEDIEFGNINQPPVDLSRDLTIEDANLSQPPVNLSKVLSRTKTGVKAPSTPRLKRAEWWMTPRQVAEAEAGTMDPNRYAIYYNQFLKRYNADPEFKKLKPSEQLARYKKDIGYTGVHMVPDPAGSGISSRRMVNISEPGREMARANQARIDAAAAQKERQVAAYRSKIDARMAAGPRPITAEEAPQEVANTVIRKPITAGKGRGIGDAAALARVKKSQAGHLAGGGRIAPTVGRKTEAGELADYNSVADVKGLEADRARTAGADRQFARAMQDIKNRNMRFQVAGKSSPAVKKAKT